jgi:hypothetical protein
VPIETPLQLAESGNVVIGASGADNLIEGVAAQAQLTAILNDRRELPAAEPPPWVRRVLAWLVKTTRVTKAPLVPMTGKPALPEDQVFGGNYQVSGLVDGYVV